MKQSGNLERKPLADLQIPKQVSTGKKSASAGQHFKRREGWRGKKTANYRASQPEGAEREKKGHLLSSSFSHHMGA